ncbi:MAG: DnaJ domain-containing protein, partial [Planctomycetota bacterium]
MSEGKHVDQPEVEADTLIGRIVDREATSGDCEAFERMASVDPILWRALALRHLDMAMLSDRVGEHTDAAERVDLRFRWPRRPAVNLLVTLSGWAAVFVVGVWWAVIVAGRGDAGPAASPVQSVAEPPVAGEQLTAGDHYDKYLATHRGIRGHRCAHDRDHRRHGQSHGRSCRASPRYGCPGRLGHRLMNVWSGCHHHGCHGFGRRPSRASGALSLCRTACRFAAKPWHPGGTRLYSAMPQDRDYYEVLGVGRDATADEIRKAYRRLARQYHPDVNQSSDAAERFAEMQEAYEVLSDAEKRRAYDRFGRAGVGVGQGPGGFGRGGVWRGNVGPGGQFDASDFSSVFEELFGGRGGSPFGVGPGRPGAQAPSRPAPQRGRDLHHTITVSFMTAAQGGSEQVHVTTADRSPQTITVKIPPGIDTGEKLRVKGKGHPGGDGG